MNPLPPLPPHAVTELQAVCFCQSLPPLSIPLPFIFFPLCISWSFDATSSILWHASHLCKSLVHNPFISFHLSTFNLSLLFSHKLLRILSDVYTVHHVIAGLSAFILASVEWINSHLSWLMNALMEWKLNLLSTALSLTQTPRFAFLSMELSVT